jgi:hypothetical protein
VLRICPGLTAERVNPVPEATELLHSNLHEVFSERDPERRRAAIERTYKARGIDVLTIRDGRVSVVRTLIAP